MTPLERWDAVLNLDLPGPQRAVLGALAFHAGDDEPLTAYPSVSTIAKRTGYNRATVLRCLATLEASGFVSRVARKGGSSTLYLIDLQPSIRTAEIVAECDSVAERDSRRVRPRQSQSATQVVAECDTNKELTRKEPGTAEATAKMEKFLAEDLATAEYIFGLLLVLLPGHRRPNFKRWAEDVRLMRERDGRTDSEIRDLFTWANRDPFWRKNVLSPAKLREKWERLAIERGKGVRGPNGAERTLAGPL